MLSSGRKTMSTHRSKEKEAKRQARLQAGKVLAAIKPARPREEVGKLMMQHLDARILEIRKLLILIDRMINRRRWQGLVAGLGSR